MAAKMGGGETLLGQFLPKMAVYMHTLRMFGLPFQLIQRITISNH